MIGVRQNAIIGLEKCTVQKAIKKSIIIIAKMFKLFSLKWQGTDTKDIKEIQYCLDLRKIFGVAEKLLK